MAEITLVKVSPFNNGFVIESSQLNQGITYYLTIGTYIIDRPYTPTKTGNIIMDSWTNIGYTPPDGNLCFTLLDSPTGFCAPLICNLIIN